MLRIKVPQGIADAAQLRALADVATRFSRGFGHVTTRQNVQLHFVRPQDLEPALRRLAEAGLTTSGAGGNTVRNVVACPLAGVGRRRGLRRDAVRRGGDALVPAPPARRRAAPQVQDRLRGLRPGPRRDRDPGPRLPRPDPPGGRRRGARLPRDRGGRHVLALHLGRRARRVPPRRRRAPPRRGGGARVPRARRPREQAAQPAQVPRPRARARAPSARSSRRSSRGSGPRAAPRLPFDPERARRPRRPRTSPPASPSPAEIAARLARRPAARPGRAARRRARCSPPPPGALERFRRTNVSPQRQAGRSVVTVSLPAGRRHRRAARGARRPRARPRRRHGAALEPRPRPPALGARRPRCPRCSSGSPRRGSAATARGAPRTSSPAPAPTSAGSP